jgi:small conductance mechanosensitive channel
MEKTATTPAADHVPLQEKLVDYILGHSGALISAIIIVIVGLIAARWIGRLMERWFERRAMEPPVRMLLVRLVKLLVLAGALIMALETAGMNLTALIAGISVAGLGVGLAMQGVLGNLVAGLTIIFTKPYRVGEYIALLSVQGQVTKIELFSTTLIHPDRSRVVIPNRKIVGEVLHNYGTVRQLDLSVGVAYGANLEEAVAAIQEILKANTRVLREPEPFIGITTLGDCSISIAVKPWTSVENFGPAGGEIYQAIVTRFRERRIDIPFPQREVRLLNNVEVSRPALVPDLG